MYLSLRMIGNKWSKLCRWLQSYGGWAYKKGIALHEDGGNDHGERKV